MGSQQKPPVDEVTVPEGVFDLFRDLYPVALDILKKADLKFPVFFTLSYLRSSEVRVVLDGGVPRPAAAGTGYPARRYHDLIETLQEVLDCSPATAIGVVTALLDLDRGLINKTDVGEQIMRTLFPGPGGGHQNTLVILAQDGIDSLNSLNADVSRRLSDVVKRIQLEPTLVSSALLRVVAWLPKLHAGLRFLLGRGKTPKR